MKQAIPVLVLRQDQTCHEKSMSPYVAYLQSTVHPKKQLHTEVSVRFRTRD